MIEMHVSIALQLLDGFTNRPLAPAQARLALDGEPVRAIAKPGGWLVLTGLAPGGHALEVAAPGFQPERMRVEGGARGDEAVLRLQPDRDYRFGRRVTTLTVRLTDGRGAPLAGRALWALDGEARGLRLAQDDAGPGDARLRLFSAEKPARLPVPGPFYLEDGQDGEMVEVTGTEDGVLYALARPLVRPHRRGCLLRPARRLLTDDAGEAFAAMNGDEALLLTENGRLLRAALTPLEHNALTLKLDE